MKERSRLDGAKLRDKGAKAEVQALLSGEADSNDAFVEIHPGAGGTEAQDWALAFIVWCAFRPMTVARAAIQVLVPFGSILKSMIRLK